MHIIVRSLPEPKFIKRPRKDEWALRTDYQFSLIINGTVRVFNIDKGYVTDGKSVPKIVEVITFGRVKRRDERYFKEVLVHDWLYDNKGIVQDYDGIDLHYNRKDADQIYREIMKHKGRSWLRVMLEYGVVSALGKKVWDD